MQRQVAVPHPGALPTDAVSVAVQTLASNGYLLTSAQRVAQGMLLHLKRGDAFGITVPYLVVLAGSKLSTADLTAIRRVAAKGSENLVVVGETESNQIAKLAWDQFIGRFGGPVRALVPLDARFPEYLEELGHNRTIESLVGRPDELFEEYVHAGLQFLLPGRVARYGSERRFEALPDGISLGEHGAPVLLYDAKAARNGYEVSKTTIRQLADYVEDFGQRYSAFVGPAHAVVLVSGHFADDPDQRKARSADLYASCKVPLVFMTSSDLAQATNLLAAQPTYRTVLSWARLFTETDFSVAALRQELSSRQRDGVAE